MVLPNGYYLVRADVSLSGGEITKANIENYCDVSADVSSTDIVNLKYLYLNCIEIEFPQDKKVKLTRFVNRGAVNIDLAEMFCTFNFKEVYLGKKKLSDPTDNESKRVDYRIKAWRYAHSEWNKKGNGKTQLIRIYNYNSGTEKYLYVQESELTVYKRGTGFVVATMIFSNGQLPIAMDAFGNVSIKAVILEERL